MITIKCKICGKEFWIYPSDIKWRGSKFCSQQCYWKSMSKTILIKCKVCGKERSICPSALKRGEGKFCSEKCYWKNLKGHIPYKGFKGKKHTEEYKRKMSKRMKGTKYALGFKHLGEAKRKMAEAKMGNTFWNNPNTRKHWFKKGVAPMQTGKTWEEFYGKEKAKAIKQNISNMWSEEKSWNWKGDDVGYTGLHTWVKKHLGRPEKCEHCGKIVKNKRYIHWANIDHKYRRNLDDWLRLCVFCHREYDSINKSKP